MNANFSPRHSRSACYLAPTPPRRKRSNDLDKLHRPSSVPNHLQMASSSNSEKSSVDHRNTIFGSSNECIPKRGRLQREQRLSGMSAMKTTSMIFDYASRQRAAAAKSIVIPRANSCDMKPSKPTRKSSPIKERPILENNNASWDRHSSSTANKSFPSKKYDASEGRSAAIRKPGIKTNMFFKNMSALPNSRDAFLSMPPKRDKPIAPNHYGKVLRLPRSPNSTLEEAQLTARKEHLMSRWESSPSLSLAPSCIVECFADDTHSKLGMQLHVHKTIL